MVMAEGRRLWLCVDGCDCETKVGSTVMAVGGRLGLVVGGCVDGYGCGVDDYGFGSTGIAGGRRLWLWG